MSEEAGPDFDGRTYVRERDHARLSSQFLRVIEFMGDGTERTLAEIADALGEPEASVSARLRDARKPRFGAHTVERRHLGRGVFAYRLIINESGLRVVAAAAVQK